MTVGSILLAFALVVAVALYIARPFLDMGRGRKSRLSKRQSLTVQKEAVLVQISSLDFDYETGKIDEDAYHQRRAEYMAEATAILKVLDSLDDQSPERLGEPAEEVTATPVVASDDIEAAIARRRGRSKTRKAAAITSKSKTPAKAKAITANGKAGFCPQCGQPADAGDKFCSHCGARLTQPQHV